MLLLIAYPRTPWVFACVQVEIDIIVDDVPLLGVSALDRITPTVAAATTDSPDPLQVRIRSGDYMLSVNRQVETAVTGF